MRIENIQDHDLFLVTENNIRGSISSETLMNQALPNKNIRSDSKVTTKGILEILQKQNFVVVDLKYPKKNNEKTKNIHFCPNNRKTFMITFTDFMLSIVPKDYKQYFRMKCEWTDKFEHLVRYRNSSFLMRHGLHIKKNDRVFSLKQKPSLETYISSNTENSAATKSKFELKIYEISKKAIFCKTLENVKNRLGLFFLPKLRVFGT